jgi:GTP-binding protein EngB required for normal cell division
VLDFRHVLQSRAPLCLGAELRSSALSLKMSLPFYPSPDLPLVAVMGPCGVGKSTFVNVATGNESLRVGHSLGSRQSPFP